MRARACSPPRAPLPRPASRARALRPAWPPRLVDVTPASHPAPGRLRAESAKIQPAPGLCERAALSLSVFTAPSLQFSSGFVSWAGLERRSVGHTRSPELTARAPAQPGSSPLPLVGQACPDLSPSPPPSSPGVGAAFCFHRLPSLGAQPWSPRAGRREGAVTRSWPPRNSFSLAPPGPDLSLA